MKKLAIGIDVGGTNTKFGLVDDKGNMYGESVISTRDYPDFDDFVEEVVLSIRQLLKEIDFEGEVIGIGIGAPNANHYQGTIENAPNLPWRGTIRFVEKMKSYFPEMPVVITNDANAAAIGEMVYGGARGMKNFVVVTLGTGLGSGFIANGQMVYGYDSYAGELGHVTVHESGRQCGCGRKGCLETYVSASGIKRTVFKLLADHTEDSEFRKLSFNDLEASMITDAALRGDPLAIEAFEYTGRILGRALANAVLITGPEAIFLFGGLAKAGKYLFEPTKKYMEENMLFHFKGKVKLLPSGLTGKNAAILGASALVWQAIGN